MRTEDLKAFDGIELDGLQFCAMVYELFEHVRQAPDGEKRLRLRPTLLEKRLIEARVGPISDSVIGRM